MIKRIAAGTAVLGLTLGLAAGIVPNGRAWNVQHRPSASQVARDGHFCPHGRAWNGVTCV